MPNCSLLPRSGLREFPELQVEKCFFLRPQLVLIFIKSLAPRHRMLSLLLSKLFQAPPLSQNLIATM